MNHPFSNRKKATIAIALIAIIAASTGIYLQNNPTTQAALINPHPGLVGWWSFNEGIGTVAGDTSGNGNTGAINGATWVDGKYGKALNFAMTSSVTVPHNSGLSLSSDFTITAWVKMGSIQSYWSNLCLKSGSYGLELNPTSHCPYGSVYVGSVQKFRYFATPLAVDTWTFLAVVYTKVTGTIDCYTNGVLDNGFGILPSVGSSPDSNTQKIYIGNTFNGIEDEVRIYNGALSATEIQGYFNTGLDFSANVLVKIPQGTTQVTTTLSWQGTGNIGVTIVSPSQNYTESMLPEYQKSSYSTSNGITSMLNIKRLSVSLTTLPNDQNWNIVLSLNKVDAYQIAVEVQK
jgi:hypothetical protein